MGRTTTLRTAVVPTTLATNRAGARTTSKTTQPQQRKNTKNMAEEPAT